MEMKPITIRVSAEAARVYEAATVEDQRKLDALLSLKLSEVSHEARPLEDVMNELSRKAQERGMTPEILDDILNET